METAGKEATLTCRNGCAEPSTFTATTGPFRVSMRFRDRQQLAGSLDNQENAGQMPGRR